ncbi:hypothetical protein BD410DRAFT_846754 [Rickenella mellea]|uniref:Uncharacterized protein n=1 Tax=Rickenella mellea TaxID=50990 RepID=A0A4Y7PE39_9AGAM|nr:hypothetical protein BD410DRAFT_846754 [Rickenella mellea]
MLHIVAKTSQWMLAHNIFKFCGLLGPGWKLSKFESWRMVWEDGIGASSEGRIALALISGEGVQRPLLDNHLSEDGNNDAAHPSAKTCRHDDHLDRRHRTHRRIAITYHFHHRSRTGDERGLGYATSQSAITSGNQGHCQVNGNSDGDATYGRRPGPNEKSPRHNITAM